MEFEYRLPHECELDREERLREPTHRELFEKIEDIHRLLREIDKRI